MRALAGCLLLTVVGCGGDDGQISYADGGHHVSDASPSTTTLRVKWNSKPPIPGPIRNDIDVETAAFRLARLQIIGDGGSGSATTAEDVSLAWDDVRPTPEEITFENAPIGLYSKIALDAEADATRHTFEITGMVRIAGTPEPFRIYDVQPLAVDIADYDVALEPGRTESMTVQLNLKPALEGVDYAALPVIGGVRTLGELDPQMITVREMVTAAFERP